MFVGNVCLFHKLKVKSLLFGQKFIFNIFSALASQLSLWDLKTHQSVASQIWLKWYDLTHQLTRHDFRKKLRHFEELLYYFQNRGHVI